MGNCGNTYTVHSTVHAIEKAHQMVNIDVTNIPMCPKQTKLINFARNYEYADHSAQHVRYKNMLMHIMLQCMKYLSRGIHYFLYSPHFKIMVKILWNFLFLLY